MAKTTKNSNDILDKLFNASIYKLRKKNITTEINSCKLLEIDDWTNITPEELQEHIDQGEIVNWIDGYDVGPSPLTNALQQGASSEIIAILVANGADINAPTVLPSGTKVTPLEIVRLQLATHDNMQKELILLRAGALDDAINWAKKQRKDGNLGDLFKKGTCLRKHLHYLGYSRGNRVFECGCNSYIYIKEKAGTFKDDCDFEIYDKGINYPAWRHQEPQWLVNELGQKFAKQFFAECEKVSFNVAMDQYYTYLASLHAGNNCRYGRIRVAQRDFRNKHFTYGDWDELIKITPNITAKAEYRKMQQKKFPKIYAQKHKKS